MKKFAIFALAALLVVAFTVPAAALENEFGGYWRTRFFQNGHFNGEKNDATNLRWVDTRTRLYYTAKINDNLKLVNKFEMDATWGSSYGSRNGVSTATVGTFVNALGQTVNTIVTSGNNRGYGQSPAPAVGADGANLEIKNTYADFNTGPVNWTVGVQPFVLFRSFFIDTDAAGMIARWKVLDNFVLAGSWLKNYDGLYDTGINDDTDSYTVTGAFWFNENISIKPSITWTHSTDSTAFWGAVAGYAAAGSLPYNLGQQLGAGQIAGAKDELNLYTYGFDFDADFDNFGVWATLIGQTGSLDVAGANDIDFKGWLGAVGGNVMLGPVDLHGQFFYSPGDDDADSDLDTFMTVNGSYYWAEIMGLGTFDEQVSANSPGDKIVNIWAVNLGTTIKPMDKLSVTADLWYAKTQKDIVFATGRQEDKLGTELDVKVTYQLVEGLNLDLIGAYLWAGDATSTDGTNNEDPYEVGAQLSLSF